MSLLTELQSLDPRLLLDFVRQDQYSPHLELLEWTVEPLRHANVIDTTGGLFLFAGQGRDVQGVRAWKLVLKVLHAPTYREHTLNQWRYWKREALANESGLLSNCREPSWLRAAME